MLGVAFAGVLAIYFLTARVCCTYLLKIFLKVLSSFLYMLYFTIIKKKTQDRLNLTKFVQGTGFRTGKHSEPKIVQNTPTSNMVSYT